MARGPGFVVPDSNCRGWGAVIQQNLAPGIRRREQEYITIPFFLKITVIFQSKCGGI
jgi:hypothetical protein